MGSQTLDELALEQFNTFSNNIIRKEAIGKNIDRNEIALYHRWKNVCEERSLSYSADKKAQADYILKKQDYKEITLQPIIETYKKAI